MPFAQPDRQRLLEGVLRGRGDGPGWDGFEGSALDDELGLHWWFATVAFPIFFLLFAS